MESKKHYPNEFREEFYLKENSVFLGFDVDSRSRLRFFINEQLYDLRKELQKEVLFPLYEIKTAGGVCGCRGERSCYTDVPSEAVYVGRTLEKNRFGKLLKITTATKKLSIDTYFQLYDGIRAFSVYHDIRNVSEGNVVLEYVSGACVYGWAFDIGDIRTYPGVEEPFVGASQFDCVDFYIARSGWGREYRWRKISANDAGLTGDRNCFDRFSVGDIGAWTTKRYFPCIVVTDNRSNDYLYCEIEPRGSWEIEAGSAGNTMYLTASGADYRKGWSTLLRPGENYICTKATLALSYSLNGIFAEMTEYRRKTGGKTAADEKMGVVYNPYMKYAWDNPTEENTFLSARAAADLGAEYFCIDAGWHDDQQNFHEYLGDWKETKRSFPNGLGKTIEKIKSIGINKVGLWFEIESVGRNYKNLKYLPKEWFFYRNGAPVLEGDKLQLDFSDIEVYNHMFAVVSVAIEKYGIEYLKFDYNHDTGPGTENTSFCLGEGLEKHTLAFRKWIKELMERFPDVIIESCASGAMRADAAVVELFPLLSVSDQTVMEKMAYIAASAPSLIPPEKCLIWVYPEREDREEIIFNCVNALTARPCLSGAIPSFKEEGLEILREFITYYHKTKAFKRSALPFWPKGLPYGNEPYLCFGLRKRGKALLFVWNINEKNAEIPLENCIAVKPGFPEKSDISFVSEENTLKIKFTQALQAAVFELEYRRL